MRKSDLSTRSMECPLCGAKPGDLCINTASGNRLTGLSHRERFGVLMREVERFGVLMREVEQARKAASDGV
jgi:hypothetical protein